MAKSIPRAKKTTLSIDKTCSSFTRKGYKRIGFGAFARVFAKGGEIKRCIKVGSEEDHYMHYIKNVGLNNQNPHLPKIYKIERFYNLAPRYYSYSPRLRKNHYYIVEMEKLIKFKSVPIKYRKQALAAAGVEDHYDLNHPRRIKATTPVLKSLKSLLAKTFKNKRDYLDCHDGNVMFRKVKGGKNPKYDLVLTDPLC